MNDYLFVSQRLGFRDWRDSDGQLFVAMNRMPEVMRYFPELPTPARSLQGIERFQGHYREHGFTYFAVDELESGQWIGMIGLMHQTYESPWTPFVDIGWRLLPTWWGQGLATEGASQCLDFARQQTNISEVHATASWQNEPSLNVMRKLNMKYRGQFTHPSFDAQHELQPVHVYHIDL